MRYGRTGYAPIINIIGARADKIAITRGRYSRIIHRGADRNCSILRINCQRIHRTRRRRIGNMKFPNVFQSHCRTKLALNIGTDRHFIPSISYGPSDSRSENKSFAVGIGIDQIQNAIVVINGGRALGINENSAGIAF